LESHKRKYFRRKGAPQKLKYKHKHPLKVHIWTSISKQGATSIVIFIEIMTAATYGEILQQSLVPFIRSAYPDNHRLHQDKEPKHTNRFIQHFFEYGIK
jgi:hypothetical protein